MTAAAKDKPNYGTYPNLTLNEARTAARRPLDLGRPTSTQHTCRRLASNPSQTGGAPLTSPSSSFRFTGLPRPFSGSAAGLKPSPAPPAKPRPPPAPLP